MPGQPPPLTILSARFESTGCRSCGTDEHSGIGTPGPVEPLLQPWCAPDACSAPHTKPEDNFPSGPQGLPGWLAAGGLGKPPAQISKPGLCNEKKLSLIHHGLREELGIAQFLFTYL